MQGRDRVMDALIVQRTAVPYLMQVDQGWLGLHTYTHTGNVLSISP